MHHVSLPISPNPGTEGRFATSARTSINAQLIAWFQHLRAKEIGIDPRFRLRDGPILLQRRRGGVTDALARFYALIVHCHSPIGGLTPSDAGIIEIVDPSYEQRRG